MKTLSTEQQSEKGSRVHSLPYVCSTGPLIHLFYESLRILPLLRCGKMVQRFHASKAAGRLIGAQPREYLAISPVSAAFWASDTDTSVTFLKSCVLVQKVTSIVVFRVLTWTYLPRLE